MVDIQEAEKEILKEWVPGVDLSKVKIRTGFFADILCAGLGASAVTLGHSIFARKKSAIVQYPPEHPLRLGLIVHEIFHVRQEKEVKLWKYLLWYIPISIKLTVRGCFAKRSLRPTILARYVGERHSLEKPAYEIQRRFLAKNWTESEAKKWGWKSEEKK